MAEDKFKLPVSSLSEIEKIIDGYSHIDGEAGLEDICKLTGMGRTTVSGSNSFLKEAGIIEGSIKKSATQLGRKLGRTIHHDQKEDQRKYWGEVIKGNEFLSNLISTVRIRRGMTEEELASHAMYAAGATVNKSNKTGANAVVDILKTSGLLEAENGKLVVATPSTDDDSTTAIDSQGPTTRSTTIEQPSEAFVQPHKMEPKVPPVLRSSPIPTIAINIQLQLPETENPVVYDNLFASLRKNLLNPPQEDDE